MQDLIARWRFCATLQLGTPLAVLARHNQYLPGHQRPFASTAQIWEGSWVPVTKTWKELSGEDLPDFRPTQMASDIGPIDADGGEYLCFLKAVRAIVEQVPEAECKAKLMVELGRPEWSPFVEIHGGAEKIAKKLKLGPRRTKKNKSE